MKQNKITYFLEQKHIDKADPKAASQNTQNPIAIAIKDRLHRFVQVYEQGHGDYDTSSGLIRNFVISENAVRFIKNWRDGKKVKPINFTINII
jgi:hypothetical protein